MGYSDIQWKEMSSRKKNAAIRRHVLMNFLIFFGVIILFTIFIVIISSPGCFSDPQKQQANLSSADMAVTNLTTGYDTVRVYLRDELIATGSWTDHGFECSPKSINGTEIHSPTELINACAGEIYNDRRGYSKMSNAWIYSNGFVLVGNNKITISSNDPDLSKLIVFSNEKKQGAPYQQFSTNQ